VITLIGIVILANKNAGNSKVGWYILKVLGEKVQKKEARETF
jgi:hypothetical protein